MVPRTQKPAQYYPKTKKLVINTIPIPEPLHDEILMRTVAASLCHSDIMVVEGELEISAGEANTIGHEAVGQVISVGSTPAARGFQKGDHVGFINAYYACFNCDGCKSHYIYCSSGKTVMQGFSADGFFQEYCGVDSSVSVVFPKDMDAVVSAPIFCAGITAYQAVLTAKIQLGEWIAVIVCGGSAN